VLASLLFLIFAIKIDRKDAFYSRDLVLHDIQGTVLVKSEGEEWHEVRNGYLLKSGESVRTSDDSSASLSLWINDDFFLDETTWIKIHELESSSWVNRHISLEIFLGSLFVQASDSASIDPRVHILAGTEVVDSLGGLFLLYLAEDGDFEVYSLEKALHTRHDILMPGEGLLVSDEGLGRVKSAGVDLLRSEQAADRDFIFHRMKRLVEIQYGDFFYFAKQNWSRFILSLMVGDESIRRYQLAWVDEIFMEAIILSVEGDRENALAALQYGRSRLQAIKYSDSTRHDSHLLISDISDRLYKLYELSRIFHESQIVSSQLLEEIAALQPQEYAHHAHLIYLSSLDLLSWSEGEELREQYIVDLAQTMQWVRLGYHDLLKRDLKRLMSTLSEEYNDYIFGHW